MPVAAIDSLWVRGRRTGIGTAVGGTVGAVFGGSLFYVLGQMFCGMQGGEDCSTVPLTLVGVLGGGAGGVVWGGAIGSAFGHWSRRVP